MLLLLYLREKFQVARIVGARSVKNIKFAGLIVMTREALGGSMHKNENWNKFNLSRKPANYVIDYCLIDVKRSSDFDCLYKNWSPGPTPLPFSLKRGSFSAFVLVRFSPRNSREIEFPPPKHMMTNARHIHRGIFSVSFPEIGGGGVQMMENELRYTPSILGSDDAEIEVLPPAKHRHHYSGSTKCPFPLATIITE